MLCLLTRVFYLTTHRQRLLPEFTHIFRQTDRRSNAYSARTKPPVMFWRQARCLASFLGSFKRATAPCTNPWHGSRSALIGDLRSASTLYSGIAASRSCNTAHANKLATLSRSCDMRKPNIARYSWLGASPTRVLRWILLQCAVLRMLRLKVLNKKIRAPYFAHAGRRGYFADACIGELACRLYMSPR